MNEVVIILGTTSEVVQKAIDHANANIVSNWMTFGVFLGATAMLVIGLIIGISVCEPSTIITMSIGIACFVLMISLSLYEISFWNQKIEFFRRIQMKQ